MDECGVDHRLYREYGRSPRGERIYQAVASKRRERTSIIAASQQNKLVAPLVFQGSCNTEVVDVYFKKMLLPALPPGSVIVLDNARFHQSPTTQKLVEAAACRLLFLPPYSPDLNPIEHLSLRLQDPPAQRSRHRRQPIPSYRQYVPMLLLVAIAATIPKAMGITEAQRLFESLDRHKIRCDDIVINMAAQVGDCGFCSACAADEAIWMEKGKKLCKSAVVLPYLARDTCGVENLREFGSMIWK